MARRWRPESQAGRALVALHGVISHAGWFEALGHALAARGVALSAIDRCGSGEARERDGRDDPAAWLGDVAAAVAEARRESPSVGLLGWCWGARAAVIAAADGGVDRLVLAAPGLAMTPRLKARVEETERAPGDDLALPFEDGDFSNLPSVRRFIAEDPLRWRSQPRAFLAAGRALRARAIEALPRVRVPMLGLLADGDAVVDNAEVARLLAPHPVRTIAGGHAIVLEKPDEVAALIDAWWR